MKVKEIISKNTDGNKMEVIAINNNNEIKTLHIKNNNGVWKYCESYKWDSLNGKRKDFIFKEITTLI